jgi:hypothetical protein
MLTRFEFKQSQHRPGGCNLGRQADVGTVFVQPLRPEEIEC